MSTRTLPTSQALFHYFFLDFKEHCRDDQTSFRNYSRSSPESSKKSKWECRNWILNDIRTSFLLTIQKKIRDDLLCSLNFSFCRTNEEREFSLKRFSHCPCCYTCLFCFFLHFKTCELPVNYLCISIYSFRMDKQHLWSS